MVVRRSCCPAEGAAGLSGAASAAGAFVPLSQVWEQHYPTPGVSAQMCLRWSAYWLYQDVLQQQKKPSTAAVGMQQAVCTVVLVFGQGRAEECKAVSLLGSIMTSCSHTEMVSTYRQQTVR